ncbi:MAG: phosphate signaling complex PhoU family protein [Phycisphaerales bacterium]
MSSSAQDYMTRVTALRGEIVAQGRRVQAMLEGAFEALFARDVEQARAVIRLDDAIDTADVEIERASVQVLSDVARAGSELEASQVRLLLTIVKVNNELERIADGGVDVAEMVADIRAVPGEFPDTFRVMANSVVGILRDASSAIERNDPRLAKVVLQSQHAVTAFKSAILRDAEERIARGQTTVEFAFRLHELANLCEVMADHCTNVAEQVIYQTTGAIVRHMETSWVEVTPKQ